MYNTKTATAQIVSMNNNAIESEYTQCKLAAYPKMTYVEPSKNVSLLPELHIICMECTFEA